MVIINRGPTRGDDLATIKLEAGVSEALTWLARELPDRYEHAASACHARRLAFCRVGSGTVTVRWLKRCGAEITCLGL